MESLDILFFSTRASKNDKAPKGRSRRSAKPAAQGEWSRVADLQQRIEERRIVAAARARRKSVG